MKTPNANAKRIQIADGAGDRYIATVDLPPIALSGRRSAISPEVWDEHVAVFWLEFGFGFWLELWGSSVHRAHDLVRVAHQVGP